MSNRIINEVKGVNRVVYDISSKPPSDHRVGIMAWPDLNRRAPPPSEARANCRWKFVFKNHRWDRPFVAPQGGSIDCRRSRDGQRQDVTELGTKVDPERDHIKVDGKHSGGRSRSSI